MAVINHDAELARAGANVTGWVEPHRSSSRAAIRWARSARVIVLVFVLTAVFADLHRADRSDHDQRARPRWRRPAACFWLGADFMGRDMFSRIVYGARISLAVGARRHRARAASSACRSA